MSEQELKNRDLDKWIHAHVMHADEFVGLKKRGVWYRPNASGYTSDQRLAGRYTRDEAKRYEYPHDEPVTIHEFEPQNYTTNPADAMAVLEKCALKGDVTISATSKGDFFYCQNSDEDMPVIESKTLPLCIAQFAKALFTAKP